MITPSCNKHGQIDHKWHKLKVPKVRATVNTKQSSTPSFTSGITDCLAYQTPLTICKITINLALNVKASPYVWTIEYSGKCRQTNARSISLKEALRLSPRSIKPAPAGRLPAGGSPENDDSKPFCHRRKGNSWICRNHWSGHSRNSIRQPIGSRK